MSIVRTQSELDAALAAGEQWIEIRSEPGVWLEVGSTTATDSATVTASGSATVTATGSATVFITAAEAIWLIPFVCGCLWLAATAVEAIARHVAPFTDPRDAVERARRKEHLK